MSPWGYKAYVPVDKWLEPSPVITKFTPGHDSRILSNASSSEQETVPIELHFSQEMNCDNVKQSITINSTTADDSTASLDQASISCRMTFDPTAIVSQYTGPITGQIPSTWVLAANLVNVSDGVHSVTVSNVSTQAGNLSTNVRVMIFASTLGTGTKDIQSVDHFLFRIGRPNNPVVFPRTGNYSSSLLHENSNGSLYIAHQAAGADKFRYS